MRKNNLSFTVMDPSLPFTTQERDLGAIISHQLHAQQRCKKQTCQLCRKSPGAKLVPHSPATSSLKLSNFPQFITSHVTEAQHRTVTCYDQTTSLHLMYQVKHRAAINRKGYSYECCRAKHINPTRACNPHKSPQAVLRPNCCSWPNAVGAVNNLRESLAHLYSAFPGTNTPTM